MHRRLILLAREYRAELALAIAFGVLAGLCSLAQAYALSAAVDGVFLGRQTLVQVWPWLRILLAVILIRGILLWLQETNANEVAIRVKSDLRDRLYTHLLRLGPVFARGERTGELTSTAVTGIEALDPYFTQFLPQLLIGTLVPATILAFVFPLDWISAIILLVTAPLIPFFMYMIGRTAEQATAGQFQILGRLSAHLLDSLQGLATLKVFGQSAGQVKNIARVADQFRDVTLRVLQVSFLSAFALELVATISTAIIAVEVGLRLLYGHMAFREALFLLVLAPEFYMPLRTLGARFHAGMAGTAAARRIFAILDVPAQFRLSTSPSRSPEPTAPVDGTTDNAAGERTAAAELTDVTYFYPGRDQPALRHIDLRISWGEHIAIVGASGAGKSTLAALLLGFLQPTAGSATVAGQQAAGMSDEGRRHLIAWVPQDPHVFNETIGANIRFGKPDAEEGEIARAASLAHLEEFIQSLPDGYATPVGEGGARLSRGEVQRLSLARAFLLDAPILVLDEPSASLDAENESQLEASLSTLAEGRTVITIAHRLNTVLRADRILVLDRGSIAEQGKHADLLAKGGVYADLFHAFDRAEPLEVEAAMPAAASAPLPAGREMPGLLNALSASETAASSIAPGLDKRSWRQLMEFLSGSWGPVAVSVLLGSLTTGSSIALMGTSAWLISAAALHPSIAALQVSIVGVRFFGISRAVFRYLERLVSHGVTFRVLRNIRVWFYSRLEPLAPARLMDFRAGDLVARAVADVETLENLYVRIVAPPFTAATVLCGTVLALVVSGASSVAGAYAVVFLVAGFGLPLSAWYFANRAGRALISQRASLHALLVDGIQGLADVLAFGRTGEQVARLRKAGSSYARTQRVAARISASHSALLSVLANFALWLALFMAIPAIRTGTIDGLVLAPIALMALASFEAVSALPLAGQLLPSTRAAAGRLLEIVNIKPAVAPAPEQGTEPAVRTHEQQAQEPPSLTIQGLSFTYPDRARPALRDISFRLDARQSMAIVGPSGGGKSTIASLLLRFWDYSAGEIRLGGSSVQGCSPDAIRAQIGYVSQDAYFFDTSLYENLRLARRGATRAAVEQAARRARIHDFILGLPQGYDTPVGEHGARLSAGERQRLALARMFIKDAPFLLMDEPTAHLDAVTEAAILTTLLELMESRTSLWITHRLVRMEQVGRIVVIHRGEIVETGSHSELLASGGLYARLWALQNRREHGAPGPLASGI